MEQFGLTQQVFNASSMLRGLARPPAVTLVAPRSVTGPPGVTGGRPA